MKSVMKKAHVYVNDALAGELCEIEKGSKYLFRYFDAYNGPSVSLTMPTTQKTYTFAQFPPFFEGLLPEGMMLEALLRQTKIDRADLLSQLIHVGGDLVGNVTVAAVDE